MRFLGRGLILWAALGLLACETKGEGPSKPTDEEPTAQILSVAVSPRVLELQVGESASLTAEVGGEGDFDPAVVWESSDEAVATVVDGVVTAHAEGEATVTATSVADPSKSAAATLTVFEHPQPTRLEVKLEGLPSEVQAELRVKGPGGFDESVSEDHTFDDLEPGTYVLTGTAFQDESRVYTPDEKILEVEVVEGKTTQAVFTFSWKFRRLFELSSGGAALPLVGEGELEVSVNRLDGYEGPVTVRLAQAPQGVAAEMVAIPADESTATLRLTSDGSAMSLGERAIHLRGTGAGTTQNMETTLRLDAIVTVMEDGAPGSLRFYVSNAEALQTPGVGLDISFPEGLEEPMLLQLTSPLRITSPMTIEGPTAETGPLVILDGGSSTGLVEVEGSAALRRIAFRNGYAHQGGAILNMGSLTLEDVVFEDNEAHGAGGGVANRGESATLSLINARFWRNTAPRGGGLMNLGGNVHVHEAVFLENEASSLGAGLGSDGGLVWIEKSEFDKNSSQRQGGAIGVVSDDPLQSEMSLVEVEFTNNFSALEGGALYVRGATASLQNSPLTFNTSNSSGGAIAIMEGSSVSIFDSELLENVAKGVGGAIYSLASLSMEGGRLASNLGHSGGALYSAGTAAFVEVTINDNGGFNGGAIHSLGPLLLDRCLVHGNEAGQAAGAIFTRNQTRISNSTIANNVAQGSGGGILVDSGVASELHILHSTVTGNEAGARGGIWVLGTASIGSSIVYGNFATSTGGRDIMDGGNVTSLGHNLFGDLTGSNLDPDPSDLVGEDPLLGELADHGGPTLSMEIAPESPAQDAIPAIDCLDLEGQPLAVDQRGAPRPAGGTCDIGAFEAQP